MASRRSENVRGRIRSPISDRRHDVRARPAGHRDHDRGHDHRDRSREVAHDLEVGAPHVEALLLRVAQEQQRDEVRDEADEREREHRARRDLRRLGQPPPGLVQDERRDREQQERVGHRGQDLEAQVAEGAAAGRRALREPDRREREGDAHDVGQDVAGIREQREAVGDGGSDDLDDEDRDAERQDRDQAAPVAGGGRPVIVAHQAALPPMGGVRVTLT